MIIQTKARRPAVSIYDVQRAVHKILPSLNTPISSLPAGSTFFFLGSEFGMGIPSNEMQYYWGREGGVWSQSILEESMGLA